MTGAQIAHSAARRAAIPKASRGDRAFAAFFRVLMYAAVGLSVLALATLLYDIALDQHGFVTTADAAQVGVNGAYLRLRLSLQ
jgi:hypothetical protein